VEHTPSEDLLENLGVSSWPIWTKEVSEFPWQYDAEETCYLLEGDVIVTPEGGDPVEIKKGDLVTFPKGMSCTWKIRKDVRKHYKFE
ncbi:MAG: cupin domain-containing protein, partial [Syntrophobacterales bacterium]